MYLRDGTPGTKIQSHVELQEEHHHQKWIERPDIPAFDPIRLSICTEMIRVEIRNCSLHLLHLVKHRLNLVNPLSVRLPFRIVPRWDRQLSRSVPIVLFTIREENVERNLVATIPVCDDHEPEESSGLTKVQMLDHR